MSDKVRFIPLETESPRANVSLQNEKRTLLWRITEITSLAISTIVLAATFVINGLSSVPGHQKFGFKYDIANVSRMYYTQITPADYTFSIWGVIYLLQIGWIVYSWTFVCRSTVPKAISPITHIAYTLVNLTNSVWVFVWDNLYIKAAGGVLVLSALMLYITLGSAAYYLYKQTSVLKKQAPIDLFITQVVVLNGIAIYMTWVTVASLIGVTTVLQYFTATGAVVSATVSLSILAAIVVVYFILENTILDRFLRYVGVVYPVIMWALTGSLVAHWGKESNGQNPTITLVLLVVATVLFLLRIVLWVVFTKFRPLPSPKRV